MWARYGDTSAFHPLPMNVLEHPELDDRLLNEVFGFFARCSTQAAAHLTDYVITRGTAVMIAGPTRAQTMIDVCVFAGLMTEREYGDGVKVYKLVDDEPDFLHLRLKKDIDWERQRKADANRPALVVPVRLRDGDACRWCGKVVDWLDRKSGRAGTYDHLEPGEPATVDTYVVCCKTCNSSRQDGSLPTGVEELLDAPTEPLYSTTTVAWLAENRWRAKNGLPVPTATPPADMAKYLVRVPGSQPDTTPASQDDPQPAGDTSEHAAAGAMPTSGAAATGAAPGMPSQPDLHTGDPQSPGKAAAAGAPPGPRAAATGAPTETQRPAAAGAASPSTAAAGASSPAPADTDGRDTPGPDRNQPDLTDTKGPGSVVSGRDGSGRVGTGSESLPPPHRDSSSRSRGRRGGRRARRSKG